MFRPDTTKFRNINIAEVKAYITIKNTTGNSKHREAKWSILQALQLPGICLYTYTYTVLMKPLRV